MLGRRRSEDAGTPPANLVFRSVNESVISFCTGAKNPELIRGRGNN